MGKRKKGILNHRNQWLLLESEMWQLIRAHLSFVLQKMHCHYQDSSFLLVYTIDLLILADFQNLLLLLENLRL